MTKLHFCQRTRLPSTSKLGPCGCVIWVSAAWNVAKAGQSIPVKLSLSGNKGLNILKPGYPKVTSIACPTASAPTDAIEAYATTANNGLIYDASANQYNFVWKTDKAWAGKCFSFDLGLIDGSSHTFKVQFTK